MYDTAGQVDSSLLFNAKVYLNRFAQQYVKNAKCNGGKLRGCQSNGGVAAFKLADAFSQQAPDMTCHFVPNAGQDWWSAFMSYPTFTAFVAPIESLTREQSADWLDTFSSIC